MISHKPVYPDFNKNSLVNLMSSILTHYNISSSYPLLDRHYLKHVIDCDKLVLFCIDGFGLNIWKKYAINYSLFGTLHKNMDKQYITSVFPSTTNAALTTMHTGTSPKAHGLFEWNMYFKEFNAVISPLPYQTVSPIYDSQLLVYKKNSGILINIPTIYEKLLQKGIKSYVLYPKQFAKSVYSNEAFKGAELSSYVSLPDLLVELKEKLEATKGKAYFFVYWPFLDTIEHLYGPFTQQVEIHIKMLNDMLQELFIKKIDNNSSRKTGFILTADHGQIACNPQDTNYLNKIKNLQSFLRKTPTGQSILPSGSARDVFLHINKSSLLKSHAEISSFLEKIADVTILNEETVNKLFGKDKAHPSFFDRLGDLLILPRDNKLVWYKYLPDERFMYKGTHGGITEAEMMIPLVANKLSALR